MESAEHEMMFYAKRVFLFPLCCILQGEWLQGFAEHKSDHGAFTPKGERQKAKKLLCDLVGDTTTSCMRVVLGAAGWFVLVFLYDAHSH